MRKSRVLQKLRNGETVFSIKMNLSDSRISEIAALAGFSCIWTDMEHTSNDWSAIEKQILAAKAYDADTVVRVARGSYSDLVRPLELDAAGIMVPHVMSLADAQAIVRQTKFHPLGLRPADGGNADGGFCSIPFTDYIREANEQRFIILQIEDPEPLDELDAIASLPGVDMLFYGPGDFSQAIGAPGQIDHPLVIETRKRVAEAAAKAGIYAGTVGSVDNCKELREMGYRFINLGADILGLYRYFSQIREQAEQSD
ncbi:MAG: aldolase [Paenibacillus sp.]|jgi:4-hydroxy-2-oxoheptanedioate aldolase|nr:aldolase [Paenibacillus sp.]